MNRLVLIGNGFDLAHGMKTSYKDFIEHLWFGIYEDLVYEAKRGSIGYTTGIFKDSNMLVTLKYSRIDFNILNESFSIGYDDNYFTMNPIKENISPSDYSEYAKDIIELATEIGCEYTNSFFKIITNNYTHKNWSDIEADYYRELLANKDSEQSIKKLNEDFDQIKSLLKSYLASLEKPNKLNELEKLIYSPICTRDIKIDALDNVKAHLAKSVGVLLDKKEFKEWFESNSSRLSSRLMKNFTGDMVPSLVAEAIFNNESSPFSRPLLQPLNVLLLNFNYTEIDELYTTNKDAREREIVLDDIVVNRNSIHGTISPDDNHMIFGYGDEEADEYKELEKSDTQGLLYNVKSINYLKTSNYRDLERFIESDSYQIFIMGMSCGMADRTILRKLFQHKNCISIKPFFYEKMNDKKEAEWDNHTELIQNISRCFSDKDLLRSIVVNKIDCLKLPQYDD